MKHLIIKDKSKEFEIRLDTHLFMKGDINNWEYLSPVVGSGIRIITSDGTRLDIPFNQYLFEIRNE